MNQDDTSGKQEKHDKSEEVMRGLQNDQNVIVKYSNSPDDECSE